MTTCAEPGCLDVPAFRTVEATIRFPEGPSATVSIGVGQKGHMSDWTCEIMDDFLLVFASALRTLHDSGEEHA